MPEMRAPSPGVAELTLHWSGAQAHNWVKGLGRTRLATE